jgi:glucosylceramidase
MPPPPVSRKRLTLVATLLCAALGAAPALAANESVQVWLTTTSGSSLAKRLNPEASQTFGPDSGGGTPIDVNPALTSIGRIGALLRAGGG